MPLIALFNADLDVEVSIKSVEGTKLAEDVSSDTAVGFNVNANLTESERGPGKFELKFTIELDSNPEVAKMAISGTAIIKGEDKEIESMITPKEGDSAPPVFMKIYQKVYAILYLISGSLKVPYPSPGLLKTVHATNSKEVSQTVPSGKILESV